MLEKLNGFELWIEVFRLEVYEIFEGVENCIEISREIKLKENWCDGVVEGDQDCVGFG